MNVLVTITFNAMTAGILDPFFACVRAQRDQDFLLLAIDNASSDGTADYLRALDLPNLRLIANQENIGFARACNQGIAFAREQGASHITFINNDTEFDARLTGGMVAALEETGAAALSPLITYHADPGRIWFATGSYRWGRGMIPYHDRLDQPRSTLSAQRIQDTAFASGCCLLFRMSVFDIVPGFDDRYFVYWEDADLCRTLAEHGLRIVTDTALECRHKVSISTGGAFSDFSVLHFTRGHMIFVRKHFGDAALALVLPIVVAKTALNVLRGRMQVRQLPIWWRGLLSGLKVRPERGLPGS